MKEAVELACYLRDIKHMPEQVQDFYPTPSTISTCMYYTGLDPRTMKPVYVEKDPHNKAMQRALIQYRKPENYYLVAEALKKAGREDLIGFDAKCLIRPRGMRGAGESGGVYRGRRAAGGSYAGKSAMSGNSRQRQGNTLSDGKKTVRKKKTIRNIHKKK